MNYNSQALPIPQKFLVSTSRVETSRNSAGDPVLHAIPADPGAALLNALDGFDDDVASLLEDTRKDPMPMQQREAL